MSPRPHDRELPAPLAHDADPMDIARCEALDLATRRRLLEEWRTDEAAVARALAEGMDGGPPPRLGEIERALDALGDSDATR